MNHFLGGFFIGIFLEVKVFKQKEAGVSLLFELLISGTLWGLTMWSLLP